MCGINGIFAFGDSAPPVDETELLRTREHMAKRGPDGAGLWISPDRRVGLAHRRLAIIDLSESGAQPMATAEGRFVITFNGEIYNYRQLRRELEAKGRVFRSNSDTEVLLQLYAERGARMVTALRGMFAFAIWDAHERTLFLARDPFGIKPLYYSDCDGTLRFASQVKALLKGGAIDAAPESAGAAGFLLWGCVPEPFTLYRGIRALPAGSNLTVECGKGARLSTYFNVSEELAKAKAVPFQTRDRIALGELLRDSVRHHLVSDVPVGIFLSAGVDSTMVASLATEQAGVSPRSLTLAFDEYRGTHDDEAPLAEQIAARLRMRHETHWIRRSEFESDLDRILSDMDQPSTDGVNTWLVCRQAARAGIKVALSGLGGDELFGGYPSFRDVPKIARWLRATSGMPRVGRLARVLLDPVLRAFTSPKFAGLLEYGGTVHGAYLLRRALFMPWELAYTLDPETIGNGLDRLDTVARLAESIRGVHGSSAQVSALEMSWYMRNQLLRDTDWAGMAHSIEIRVPLVDAILFRGVAPWLASRTPPSKTDAAFATAYQALTPVLKRPKTGFGVPVERWASGFAGRGGAARTRGLRGWARHVLRKVTGRRPRVLISTLLPSHGGVRTMTGLMVKLLRRRGYVIEIAHYIPYRIAPELSVPAWMILFRRPGSRLAVEFGDLTSHQIGARFPELEWFRCLPSRAWRELVPRFDYFVTVSGSALSSLPVVLQGEKCVTWVATPYLADRRERALAYPWYRKIVDKLFDAPMCALLEKIALRRSNLLALSNYTARELRRIAGGPRVDVMPMPIDTTAFYPMGRSAPRNRIGFCARFSDPRKNIGLLFEAVALCQQTGMPVECSIAGDKLTPEIAAQLRRFGLEGKVRVLGEFDRPALREFYNELDVFVIPSEQEGLGIVGLEAMACGCPVVSTRCGGPEDYVEEGVNGHLVGFTAQEMVAAIHRVLKDPDTFARMSEAAVRTVRSNFSEDRIEAIFSRTFDGVFGLAPAVPR